MNELDSSSIDLLGGPSQISNQRAMAALLVERSYLTLPGASSPLPLPMVEHLKVLWSSPLKGPLLSLSSWVYLLGGGA